MPPHNQIPARPRTGAPAKPQPKPGDARRAQQRSMTAPRSAATQAITRVSRPMESIISLPNPKLQLKSKKVTRIDAGVQKLAQDMIAAVIDWESTRPHEFGAALSAVQIGQLARVMVIRNSLEDRDDKTFGVFINPEIIKTDGRPTEAMEGCLSIPDIYGRVARYPRIKIKAQNLQGQPIRLNASGFLARVIQHEIDHLDGVLFTDRITDINKLYRLGEDGQFTKYQPPAL